MVKRFNKKGAAEEIIYWFFYIPLTAIVIITLVVLASSILNQSSSTNNLEYYIFSQRAVNAIYYQDTTTGRPYPGIIDINRWNEMILGNAFDKEGYKGLEFGLKLTLTYLDKSELPSEVYSDKDSYEISKEFYSKQRENYVLVKQGDNLRPAKLNIDLAYHQKRYPD